MNSTAITLGSDAQQLFQYSLYIFSGSTALVGSTMIIVVILRYQVLRTKQFYLLCGLAGGDALQGVACVWSGIRRVILVSTNQNVLVTPFDCMKEFYNTFFLFGQECSMIMIFWISFDRFLAIKAFNRYRTLGTRYAFSMIAGAYSHSAIAVAIGWYTSAFFEDQVPVYPLICLTPYAVPDGFYAYHGLAQLIPGLGSLILYVFAFVSASALTRTQSTPNSVQMAEKRRQAQLTKNVAEIVFYTFFCTTVPFGIVFFFVVFGLTLSSTFSFIAPFMWTISCFHGCINLFIYIRKYPKFRACLKKLLGIKEISSGHALNAVHPI